MYPFLLLVDGLRPDIHNLPKVGLFAGCVAVLALFLNKIWGTNFLFLSRTDNNPMLNLIANVFGNYYRLGLVLLVFVMWLLLYLPWTFRKKAK